MKRLFLVAAIASVFACARGDLVPSAEVHVKPRGSMPTVIADLGDHQPTGIAVSRSGRIFVSFPRWSDNVPISVAELQGNGSLAPFPRDEWNSWQGDAKTGSQQFVCVQSVYVDADDHLWVLDPASPNMDEVVAGAAKLVEIDLATDRVVRAIVFSGDIAPAKSYLNDVRIDTKQRTAYLTDSGLGGIIVVDLNSEQARRVLSDHPSTKAELVTPLINGVPLQQTDGRVPQVRADGIALDPQGAMLYYHALTGRTLYRVPTQDLRDVSLTSDMLGARVETVTRTAAADGMIFDGNGRLYLTDIENSAVTMIDVRTPGAAPEVIAQSPLLDWPDSIAVAPDGALVVTASQIERMPRFKGFNPRSETYKLVRLAIDDRSTVSRR